MRFLGQGSHFLILGLLVNDNCSDSRFCRSAQIVSWKKTPSAEGLKFKISRTSQVDDYIEIAAP
jgi:hypothetical protein